MIQAIEFDPCFVESILAGRKTVTRRRWAEERMKVDDVVEAIGPTGAPFELLRILSLEREEEPGRAVFAKDVGKPVVEQLPAMREEAEREGYPSWQHFLFNWAQRYGLEAMEQPCWRIEFELLKAFVITQSGREVVEALRSGDPERIAWAERELEGE